MMLFNVYYNENNFPFLNEIKYIINETTQEKLTISEFLNNISQYDEINYIANMPVFFPLLEEEMIRQKYECKTTSTPYYYHYSPKLKPKTYCVDIYVRSDNSNVMKYVNKMRIGTTNGQKYFINFNSFTTYQEINTPFHREEVEYASYLSNIGCKTVTPAGAMREQYGIRSLNSHNIVPGFAIAARDSINNPALIEAYDLGYFKEAWGYDVNSMYLAMMKQIKYLPDAGLASVVKQAQLVPPNHFGWHQKDVYTWEVKLEGEIIWPGDWLVPPCSIKNKFIDMVDMMYKEKQASKKKGGAIYRFYKQKANSFIGSFAKKNRMSTHYKYWSDEKGRKDKDFRAGTPRYDIFAVITTMARRYITVLMDKARAFGCRVLQVNTDGFIVDKPLPESMLGEGLGELRFDKHLTNLYIFSPNQYVADGVQCISGLPSGMYKPGKTNYTYNKIMWVPSYNGFRLIETKIDLMSELKMNFVELEDVIKYEQTR